jgi:uncharacterized repeat protein (TIGR01451 family)
LQLFHLTAMKKNIFFFLFFLILLSKNIYSSTVATGYAFSLYICSDSTVWGFGQNSQGQLGDSTSSNQFSPVRAKGLTDVISIEASDYKSLALKSDGTVWSWGFQLAIPGYSTSLVPVQVPGIDSVKKIAAGNNYAIAVRTDGTVWYWGSAQWGELGDSVQTFHSSPTQLTGLSGILDVCAGYSFTIFLKNDGSVWGLGRNVSGQLGYNNPADCFVPVHIAGLSRITHISSCWDHSLAIDEDHYVWAWGNSANGQLFNVSTNPGIILDHPDIVSVCAGVNVSYLINSQGRVFTAGTNWAYQLSFANLDHVVAISGNQEHGIAIRQDGTIWGAGNHQHGELGTGTHIAHYSQPEPAAIFCVAMLPWEDAFNNHLGGIVYIDMNGNCIYDSTEINCTNIPIQVMPGGFNLMTNVNGQYFFGFNNPGTYTITPQIPSSANHLINQFCPVNQTITVNSNTPTDSLDFNFGIPYVDCYQLNVEIAHTATRLCSAGNMYVTYRNDGLATADSVVVHVHLDPDLTFASASIPFVFDSANAEYMFQIGSVLPMHSGVFLIQYHTPCSAPLTGHTACSQATITPVNHCYLDSTTGSNWDSTSVSVDSRCINDTVHFYIINNSVHNMLSASSYRVYTNNQLIRNGNFQLIAGDTLEIVLHSNGSTLRLEADQSTGHPGSSHPLNQIEGCGSDSTGAMTFRMINQVPMNDIDPDFDIDCIVFTAAIDPNEKVVAPEGVGMNHVVLPGTPLEYTIRFQNTGTDTAYKVIVVDTLDATLDFNTFEAGTSSHPYVLNVERSTIPVLHFTFDNIYLPDSTTDELHSHGLIKFRISPVAGLTNGTQIDNDADIYFDINDPVRTNTSFVTIGQYIILSRNDAVVKHSLMCYPNPSSDHLYLFSGSPDRMNLVSIYSIDGKEIRKTAFENADEAIINLAGLMNGVYFLKCRTTGGEETIRVLKGE